MLTQKRLLILLGFLTLFFIFLNNSSSAQENKVKQEIKNNQDKIEHDLKDRVAGLEKEKEEITKQGGVLTKQIATLKEKINLIEKDRVFLESMLSCQYSDLRLPKLVKADEKNLDEVICLNLGFAYGLKGKIKDAIEEYEKALKYAPEDKDIHYNLGYLLAKQNKCKEAIEEYKKALTGLSDDREVYYNLSIVYAACLKDAKTADYYYNKFLRLTSVDRGNP